MSDSTYLRQNKVTYSYHLFWLQPAESSCWFVIMKRGENALYSAIIISSLLSPWHHIITKSSHIWDARLNVQVICDMIKRCSRSITAEERQDLTWIAVQYSYDPIDDEVRTTLLAGKPDVRACVGAFAWAPTYQVRTEVHTRTRSESHFPYAPTHAKIESKIKDRRDTTRPKKEDWGAAEAEPEKMRTLCR